MEGISDFTHAVHPSILAKLNESETARVIEIVQDLVEKKDPKTLNDLIKSDYEEMPVDIKTFITHPDYLGEAVQVFPFWQEKLIDVFEGDRDIVEVACIAGDSLIPTLDGKIRTIKDLADMYIAGTLKDIYTYTYDRNLKKVVPTPCIRAWKTGRKMLYKITLSNGKSIRCSADHRILTIDNEWHSIDNGLKVGSSLMPLYSHHQINIVISEEADNL